MFGAQPPLRTRERVGAQQPTNDPYTATSSSSRGAATSRPRAPRGPYRTARDWETLDPTARIDSQRYRPSPQSHFVRAIGSVYDSVDLASDYVDVWAEQNEAYGEHTPFMDEWNNVMRQRGLQMGASSSSSSSSSSSASAPYDPLSDALSAAMGNGGGSTSPPPTQNATAPPTAPTPTTDDAMEIAVESDMGDDERDDEHSGYSSAASSVSDVPIATVAKNLGASTNPRRTLDAAHFPPGGKNAKRRRERTVARMHERADRMQQQCDATEREIMSRTGVATTNTTTTTTAADITTTTTSTTATATTTITSGAPNKVLKDYTPDHFFDALDAAVKHAQATSTATVAEHGGDVRQLVNAPPPETTPTVHTTAYMQQICGSIMADIDPLVAYRMIFTVDYILSVHQSWSARMHVPVEARPRMRLKVAAAFLRNDSLYIDRCTVLEPNEVDTDASGTTVGAARAMVQFSCKFNNMLAEDQEEADRKRKPFRPFNEVELRADVDEYCVATSLWACDTPGRLDECNSAVLSDSATAYEKAPMGDVLVYWHSFSFGFRAHGATHV